MDLGLWRALTMDKKGNLYGTTWVGVARGAAA